MGNIYYNLRRVLPGIDWANVSLGYDNDEQSIAMIMRTKAHFQECLCILNGNEAATKGVTLAQAS